MIGCREVNAQGVESLDTRLHCFQDALTRKGLYHPEYTKYGAYYPMYGYELLKELYQEGNLPTALFVANDSMAAGSYRAAYELGLHIPEDISIIGFNDIPAAKIYDSAAYDGPAVHGIYGRVCRKTFGGTNLAWTGNLCKSICSNEVMYPGQCEKNQIKEKNCRASGMFYGSFFSTFTGKNIYILPIKWYIDFTR